MATHKLLLLPGDGIGPEVMAEVKRLIGWLNAQGIAHFETEDGLVGGAAYAAIPAFLKTRFNTNEILTSLMLVYVAQLFLDWLVRGPWRDPQGYNFPQTVQFNDSAILPAIWPQSGDAHWGFVFALVAAVALWLVMGRTFAGFEIRVLGSIS